MQCAPRYTIFDLTQIDNCGIKVAHLLSPNQIRFFLTILNPLIFFVLRMSVSQLVTLINKGSGTIINFM